MSVGTVQPGVSRVIVAAALAFFAASLSARETRPFQDLWIPPLLTGTSFDLTLSASTKSFWAGATTKTLGYNGAPFWGPTLVFNAGDTVKLKVTNATAEATTVHWHGLHLPAVMDGGPHALIEPGATWTPSFTVMNRAATYWYHPHPHEATQKQLTYGAGGLILVKDPIEAALKLPRTYGVDDIPLVFTSRRFYADDQFSFEGDNDKYGDYLLANGTLDPQVSLPAQVVRLRILNAEVERGYVLGFSDNRTFHLIATDGGLVDKPVALTRLKLMVGERVELLVDLSAEKRGGFVNLMAYNARQPFGFPGGEPGRSRPNGGLLNDQDFRMLRINIAAPTAAGVKGIPTTLTHNAFPTVDQVTQRRTIHVTRGNPKGEFAFDNASYDMHDISRIQLVKLGAVEAWTITNSPVFGHAFHIHDVQFKIVERSDGPVADYEQGWKDSVYVPRAASVTFVARFDDFASDTDSFMYHCHMANHEDSGLMGEFMVAKDPAAIDLKSVAFRERHEHPITQNMLAAADRQALKTAPAFESSDLDGKALSLASLTEKKPLVLFFIEEHCPCSRDASPFLDAIQADFGDACTVVGVINAEAAEARGWVKAANCHYRVIADPNDAIITAYAAQRSVYTTLIAPGGKIAKTYPGYSAEMLTDLASRIVSLGAVPAKPFSFDAAPKKLTAGCPFIGGHSVDDRFGQ